MKRMYAGRPGIILTTTPLGFRSVRRTRAGGFVSTDMDAEQK